MIKIGKSGRFWVFAGAAGLALLLLFALMINGLRQDAARLLDFEEALQLRQEDVSSRRDMRTEIEAFRQRLKQKRTEYFSIEDIKPFSRDYLPTLFDEHGLLIESISFLAVVEDSDFLRYHPLQLEFVGGFESAMAVIQDLEGYDKTLRISEFVFNKVDPRVVKVMLTINLYVADI